MYAKFAVVDNPMSYNTILRRPILNNYEVVINMEVICLKLPAIRGITVARSNQKSTQKCYRQSTKVVSQVSLSIELLEKLESSLTPNLENKISTI